MNYIGEHLLPGQIGHFCIVLGFTAAIVAAVCFFLATQRRDDAAESASWLRLGRGAYVVHGVSMFTLIACIFYVMTHKMYEYEYAQHHVSDELPFKYIFAAFWEGQEGSFLLWMFWHIVLGIILIFTAKKWESPVLATLSTVQIFLSSMILGLHFGFGENSFKLGANPMLLIRETIEAPIFKNPEYLKLIKGNGLNPLLQNYWMTIHPPTLFLGFASTVVPFCYAISGLWLNEHKNWMRPALVWSLFSAAILGTGVLMGGAWAYEALSFGGYWAWDPVENMSLVPWLVLVAGIHTHLVAKHTGHSIKSTYIFYILTFLLVLYSTFLTRSGVLGDTSVHAFTQMGLEWQLVVFLGFFALVGTFLYAKNQKYIPVLEKEEAITSKEFWMFIGALVLLFSAILISFTTSIPVYNKIFDAVGSLTGQDFSKFHRTAPLEPIAHYNKYQLWIGVFVGLLSGTAQYLRWREFNFSHYAKKFGLHLAVSMLITAALTWLGTTWIQANAWQYVLLLFAGIFTVISNLDYILTFLKLPNGLRVAGSVMSHVGFGLMIIGILASGLNKQFISTNLFVQEELFENASRNIMLLKNVPITMSGYEVTYTNDTLHDYWREFQVNYKKIDAQGTASETFTLMPSVIYDKTFTKVAASNPDTKRYWNKDIFTHIASLPREQINFEEAKNHEDTLHYTQYEAFTQDTFYTKKHYAQLTGLNFSPKHPEYKPETGDLAVGAKLIFKRLQDTATYRAEPVIVLRRDTIFNFPVQVNELGMRVKLKNRAIEKIFSADESLKYQTLSFKEGDTQTLGALNITFEGFKKSPKHPQYTAQEGDIAVGAVLKINGTTLQPVYLIRDSRPYNLKDQNPMTGIHARFVNIDPAKHTVQIAIAQQSTKISLPMDIAENSPRRDFIVLEAIVFPGINYFWIGATLMCLGLAVSMVRRMREKHVVA
jgi:cytochrome c-type biogenesis protein CcmF